MNVLFKIALLLLRESKILLRSNPVDLMFRTYLIELQSHKVAETQSLLVSATPIYSTNVLVGLSSP